MILEILTGLFTAAAIVLAYMAGVNYGHMKASKKHLEDLKRIFPDV